jgi:hypothetical protein
MIRRADLESAGERTFTFVVLEGQMGGYCRQEMEEI